MLGFYTDLLPEVIKTNCENCPIEIKMYAVKFINYLQENDSKNWNKILKKYNLSGDNVEKFLKHLSNQNNKDKN